MRATADSFRASQRPSDWRCTWHPCTGRSITSGPSIVILDPISNLISVGNMMDVKSMLTRLIDYLKTKGITTLCTSLVDYEDEAQGGQGVSSLMDTWLKLSHFETSSERNRGISVIKSRGMAHSNQIREFLLTDQGIEIMDVYLGPGGRTSDGHGPGSSGG